MDGIETLELGLPVTVPNLPSFARKQDINVRYAVLPPYAYIHIHWDIKRNELVYEVEEPILDQRERNFRRIRKRRRRSN